MSICFIYVIADLLIPINDNQTSYVILGVMTCLKSVLPHIKENQRRERNIFDTHKTGEGVSVSLDKLLQVKETYFPK
jgi:hypothetical protein